MLTYHVHSWGDNRVLQTVLESRPAALKILPSDFDPISEWVTTCQPTTLVIRRYFGFDEEQSHFIDRGAEGAREVVDTIARDYERVISLCQGRGMRVYIEGLNEVSRRYMWDDIDRYNEFSVWFARYARERGLRPALFGWATGNLPGKGWEGAANPDHRGPYPTFIASLAAHWEYVLPAIQEAVRPQPGTTEPWGAVTSNGYGGDSMTQEPWKTWHVLRYRMDREAIASLDRTLPPIPWLRGETGIDAQLVGKPIQDAGWKSVLGPARYAAELGVTDRDFADDDVIAAIFDLGALPPFKETFEVVAEPAIITAVRRSRDRYDSIPVTPPSGGVPAPHPKPEPGRPVELAPEYHEIWAALDTAQRLATKVKNRDLVTDIEYAKDEIRESKGEKRTLPVRK